MSNVIPTGHGGKRNGSGRKPKAASTDQPTIEADYNAARARREQALAELAEIELGIKREELIPAGDVLEAWSAIVSVMRQRLLSLPSRLAAVVPGHSTHQETEAAAMVLVRECLTDLASAGEDGMKLAEARRK